MRYTNEYINTNFPDHDRHSCGGDNEDTLRGNRDLDQYMCLRCIALELQSLEILREKIKINPDIKNMLDAIKIEMTEDEDEDEN